MINSTNLLEISFGVFIWTIFLLWGQRPLKSPDSACALAPLYTLSIPPSCQPLLSSPPYRIAQSNWPCTPWRWRGVIEKCNCWANVIVEAQIITTNLNQCTGITLALLDFDEYIRLVISPVGNWWMYPSYFSILIGRMPDVSVHYRLVVCTFIFFKYVINSF